jgi:hypothetical protein
MSTRDWLEWGAVAAPVLSALASWLVMTFVKPKTLKQKLMLGIGLMVLGLSLSTIVYWHQRSFRTSNISFEVGNGSPFVITQSQGLIFVRVRVVNNSWQEAICRLFLTDLAREGDQQPILNNESILMAAGNTGGEGYQEQTIGPTFGITFDIAYIVPGIDNLKIQSRQDQFLEVFRSPLPPGDYKFTVRTNGKNCTSEPKEIFVRYQGSSNVSILAERSGKRPNK